MTMQLVEANQGTNVSAVSQGATFFNTKDLPRMLQLRQKAQFLKEGTVSGLREDLSKVPQLNHFAIKCRGPRGYKQLTKIQHRTQTADVSAAANSESPEQLTACHSTSGVWKSHRLPSEHWGTVQCHPGEQTSYWGCQS